MTRRDFVVTGLAAVAAPRMSFAAASPQTAARPITIAKTSCGFEREPMVRPFGFKGGYLTEEWIVSAYVHTTSGHRRPRARRNERPHELQQLGDDAQGSRLSRRALDAHHLDIARWGLGAAGPESVSGTCTWLDTRGMMCMELGRGRKDGFSLNWDVTRETTGKAEYDALMKPFANGKFNLNANLAEYGLNFDQGMGGIRDGSFDTVRSA